MSSPKGPVLIDREGQAELTPATAPLVPDLMADGRAMRTAVAVMSRRPSWPRWTTRRRRAPRLR